MYRSVSSLANSEACQLQRKTLVSMLLFAGVLFIANSASAALTTATIYETPATAPSGALWLNDSSGGHLWVSDHISGFCRLDPAGNGTATLNQDTCYNFGLGGSAGQPAFDPTTHFLYLPDLSSKSSGITRLEFDPSTATLIPDTIIAPNGGIGGDRPDAVALGPDGDLYVAFRKNGNIAKVTNPGCIDTATINCATIQKKVAVGKSSDGKRVVNLAFAGSDLYLAETALLTRIRNVSTCTGGCSAVQTVTVNQPQALAYDGKYLYVGNTTSVLRSSLAPGGNPSIPVSYATGFAFVSGLAIKQSTLSSPESSVFAGDDPSAGITANSGRWWIMPALQ